MRFLQRLSRLSQRVVARLVLVTVLAGLVAASTGALLVDELAGSALTEEIADQHLRTAQELAVRLDTRIDSLATSLRLAASQPAIHAMDRSVEPALRSVLTVSNAFDELVLFDLDGRPVAAAAAHFLAQPSDYPARTNLEPDLDLTVEVVETFPPTVELGMPVEFPPGTAIGVLIARVPLEVIAAPIQQVNATSTAEQFLVDGGGLMLVHPARDRVARGERFPFAAATVTPSRRLLSIDGRASIVSVAPTDRLRSIVVIVQDLDEALAPLRNQLRALSLIVVGVIGAVVVAVSLAGRRLLRPLNPLAAAVERVGRGERDVRAPVPPGEIGAVSRQFNLAAERLDRRREELAEMHDLAVAVTSRSDRSAVVTDIVAGIGRLLRAETTALFDVVDGNELSRVVSQGDRTLHSAMRSAAAAAVGSGRIETAEVGEADGNIIAIPLASPELSPSAIITVTRPGDAPGPDEIRLAETFSFFAAAALENVRRLEAERVLIDELQVTLDQRRDLIGNISHDLRAPTVSIHTLSSRLAARWRGMQSDDVAASLVHIEEQARELDELIGSLFEYTAAERGPRQVTMAPVAVRRVTHAAMDAVSSLLGDRPVEIDTADVEVEADFVLLRRVLIHLLSNAVRFSPPAAPVTIRTVLTDDRVRIQVEDRGPGLTEAEAAMAFEPFWRASTEPTIRTGGLGVGLSLAAEYVRTMGGTVGVDSDVGRGSKFYVVLAAAESLSD